MSIIVIVRAEYMHTGAHGRVDEEEETKSDYYNFLNEEGAKLKEKE